MCRSGGHRPRGTTDRLGWSDLANVIGMAQMEGAMAVAEIARMGFSAGLLLLGL
jgi:hypothetical protein